MRLASYIKGSMTQFRLNLIRTLLTLLGIIFGVASVIAMLTIGEGAQRQIIKNIESMGAKLVHIDAGKVDDAKISEIVNDSIGLSQKDVAALLEVIPMQGRDVAYHVRADIRVTSLPAQAQELGIYAVSDNFVGVIEGVIMAGRNFTVWDFSSCASVAIISRSYAKRFFETPENALGKSFRMNYRWFQVIGVLGEKSLGGAEKSLPASLGKYDSSILIPVTTYREKIMPEKTYSGIDKIIIKARDLMETSELKRIVGKILAVTHNRINDYEITSPQEILEQKKTTQAILNIVLFSIASISLLVGGIGIMNIMLSNVMERRHEIGIRRAIGARKKQIMIQFLLESVIICLIGGLSGIVLGIVSSLVILYFTRIPVAFSAAPIFLSFGIAFGVGVVFGIFPARRAAEINPIEALHNE
ncbi:MAG: ABC transporter permease [Candidatus Wallbacteria bacterium]|nr:ABC transporter permease [Candidatus Wallbacteria bacterium]